MKITIWKKGILDLYGDFEYVFNHIENGWNLNNEPTPKTKIQECFWKGKKWEKEFAYLMDGHVQKIAEYSSL